MKKKKKKSSRKVNTRGRVSDMTKNLRRDKLLGNTLTSDSSVSSHLRMRVQEDNGVRVNLWEEKERSSCSLSFSLFDESCPIKNKSYPQNVLSSHHTSRDVRMRIVYPTRGGVVLFEVGKIRRAPLSLKGRKLKTRNFSGLIWPAGNLIRLRFKIYQLQKGHTRGIFDIFFEVAQKSWLAKFHTENIRYDVINIFA